MKKIILLIYATLLAFLNSLKGFAYDIKTHKDITKATINSSVVSGYLQNYLGVKPEVDRWNAHVYFRTNSSLLRIAERERSTALILSVDPSQSRMSKNDIDKAIKIAWSIGEQIITYLANNDAAFTSLVKNSS